MKYLLILLLIIPQTCLAIEIGKQTTLHKPLDEQVTEINRLFDSILLGLAGRIAFSDGAITDGEDGENLDGQFQIVTDTGAANTEFSITHTLGRTPVGFLVVTIDKGGVCYESGTSWTATTIYLKCSAANAAVTLFIY